MSEKKWSCHPGRQNIHLRLYIVKMSGNNHIQYGLVGADTGEPRIAAFGTASIVVEEPKAWTCPMCTFHNAETLGKFCSMCGSPRKQQSQHPTEDSEPGQSAPARAGPSYIQNDSQGSYQYYHEQLGEGQGSSALLSNQVDSYDNYIKEQYGFDDQAGVTQAQSGSTPHTQHGQHSENDNRKPPPTYDNEEQDFFPTDGDLRKPPPVRSGRNLSPPPPRNSRKLSPVRSAMSPKSPRPASNFNLQFSPDGGRGKSSLSSSSHHRHRPDGPVLEQSFNVDSLMAVPPFGADSTHEPKADDATTAKSQDLNERDFQMSFANWSISDQGAWTCVACTFVNTNPLHLTCEVCGQKRPSKVAAEHSQKIMQEAFSNSMRSGQSDFLQRQQEKIEEIEEKAIATARMSEIIEIQEELFSSFNDGSNSEDGYHHEEVNDKAETAQEYLGNLEGYNQQEIEEQHRMEEMLAQRRQEIGLDDPTSDVDPEQFGRDALEILGQERMLQEWKEQTRHREAEIERIRQRQAEIYSRLQNMP